MATKKKQTEPTTKIVEQVVKRCEGCEKIEKLNSNIVRQMDFSKLKPLLKERATLVIKQFMTSFDERIEAIISQNLESIVAGALGFRHSFGRWEPDSKGFASTHISEIAQQHAQRMVDLFLVTDVGVFLKDETFKQMRKSAQQTYEYSVKNKVEYLLREHVEKQALKEAKEIFEHAIKDAQKEEEPASSVPLEDH